MRHELSEHIFEKSAEECGIPDVYGTPDNISHETIRVVDKYILEQYGLKAESESSWYYNIVDEEKFVKFLLRFS